MAEGRPVATGITEGIGAGVLEPEHLVGLLSHTSWPGRSVVRGLSAIPGPSAWGAGGRKLGLRPRIPVGGRRGMKW